MIFSATALVPLSQRIDSISGCDFYCCIPC